MSDFISRHAGVRIGQGVGGAARINQAEEIIGIPWIYQLALEGRIFTAGHGIEEAGIDDDDGVLDEEAGIVIVAPASGTLVLPLYLRAYFDTEQAQIPSVHLSYVQADKAWGDSTGTALTKLNCLGGASPRSAQALVFTAAVADTAISNAENVVLHERTNGVVSFITNEMATTDRHVEGAGALGGAEFVWTPEFPIVLNEGSALYFSCFTPSAQSKYNYTVSWAELDAGVYLP